MLLDHATENVSALNVQPLLANHAPSTADGESIAAELSDGKRDRGAIGYGGSYRVLKGHRKDARSNSRPADDEVTGWHASGQTRTLGLVARNKSHLRTKATVCCHAIKGHGCAAGGCSTSGRVVDRICVPLARIADVAEGDVIERHIRKTGIGRKFMCHTHRARGGGRDRHSACTRVDVCDACAWCYTGACWIVDSLPHRELRDIRGVKLWLRRWRP